MSETSPFLATVAALSSVLDRIDASNITQPLQQSVRSVTTAPSSSLVAERTTLATVRRSADPAVIANDPAAAVDVWLEYFDPASNRNYYHNPLTKETTWDKPKVFVPVPAAQAPSPRLSSGDEYRYAGAFNTQSGRFTTVKPHLFDPSTGQAVDRAVRQLGHYVDLQELERNRETTKRKREEECERGGAAPPAGEGSWREYNKEKKDEKRRKKLDALLHGV